MDAHPYPPLVLIEWLDSGQPMPSWQWLAEIEDRRPHLCVSVGFLLQDDGQAVVVAPNLGASNGDDAWDQASGAITIPALAVQRMLPLYPTALPSCSVVSQPPADREPEPPLLRQVS
jgi:hypothetical protein